MEYQIKKKFFVLNKLPGENWQSSTDTLNLQSKPITWKCGYKCFVHAAVNSTLIGEINNKEHKLWDVLEEQTVTQCKISETTQNQMEH